MSGIHKEVAALLDGDMDKAKAIIKVIGTHIAAEAGRIANENAPAIRAFGGEWCEKEARFRELAALFMGSWSRTLDLNRMIVEINEKFEESEALYARVNKLLKEF